MQLPDKQLERFQDRRLERELVRLLPGDYYVSVSGEAVTTVLGSCVSACIRDRQRGIGGMNHFMLPTPAGEAGCTPETAGRFGMHAMSYVIDRLVQHGAVLADLEVKLFGGGRIIDAAADVGKRNIDFSRQYLADNGLQVEREDLGLAHPRKLIYFTDTGKVMVKKLRPIHNRSVAAGEAQRRGAADASVARQASA